MEPANAVFLSYASEDAPAAERLCASLRAAGIEVWFDRSELRGGDVWDATIRRQIKNCALFIPIVSAHSQKRAEGYFRLEWKLAVDRSHLIAPDRAFIVPVVVDDTADSVERVPDKFREVQWVRLPEGRAPPAFVERIARLLRSPAGAAPGAATSDAPSPPPSAPSPPPSAPSPPSAPPAAHSRIRRAGLATLAVLAAVGAGLWGARSWHSHATAPAPYSREDRRMTFAMLPLHAPADDARATAVAKATTEALSARLEADSLWAQAAPRRSVAQAVERHTDLRQIAQALDVHFLIRGTVVKSQDGYAAELAVVDGDSERVLATKSLDVPAGALEPRHRFDVEGTLGALEFAALEAEVKRAANKPDDQLDVRDLSYRALVHWATHDGGAKRDTYTTTSDLLKRALALAPDDRLAIYLTADINLCDCVMAWSHNVEEQKAVGAAALARYLEIDPTNEDMLVSKAQLFQLRGRFDDALILTDSMLQRDPDDPIAQWVKGVSLLRLGRVPEAVSIADALVERFPNSMHSVKAFAADAHYAAGDYAGAARLARMAAAQISEARMKGPVFGPVRLTLAAAEARLGHLEGAHAALQDFYALVPDVRTLSAMQAWIYQTADLKGFQPLFDGLKLAGVSE